MAMKIAIVKKDDLSIVTWYEAEAASQGTYGGPWGNPDLYEHIGLDSGDYRAASAVLVSGDIELQIDSQNETDLAAADAKAAVIEAIEAAEKFGRGLMKEISYKNLVRGITGTEVVDFHNDYDLILSLLQTGSLTTALTEVSALVANPPLLEQSLIDFVETELQTYLGV